MRDPYGSRERYRFPRIKHVTRILQCRTAENKPKANSVLTSKDGWKTDDLRLVCLYEWPLETPYTAVIGTVRRLNEAYRFAAGCLDKTGVGEGPFEAIRGFMRGNRRRHLNRTSERGRHG
jgi:hypothetical protein